MEAAKESDFSEEEKWEEVWSTPKNKYWKTSFIIWLFFEQWNFEIVPFSMETKALILPTKKHETMESRESALDNTRKKIKLI